MSKLTHLDEKGAARMVDVSAKDATPRTATARARIAMKPETLAMIREGTAKKGDVLAAARIAGIMAAKRTHELIPKDAIEVSATVKVDGKTGVEMEALTACSIACLTIYDMCKSADRGMTIADLRLVEKSGGKSGPYRAE
jgi:cyclic pyranopterin monophosphate synthase